MKWHKVFLLIGGAEKVGTSKLDYWCTEKKILGPKSINKYALCKYEAC